MASTTGVGGLTTDSMPWEAKEVDRWLRDGNPTLGWRGDARLDLRVGVLTATKNGIHKGRRVRKGDALAVQWQVWRHLETGEEEIILQRKINELIDIIPTLIVMDPRTPGFEPVMDTVEREDALIQKHKETAIAEAVGEKTEYLWHLVADSQNGKQTHRQVGGFDERPDRNLAK